MAIVHVLVLAVLVLVGQSPACVEWVIVNPTIIFGKTVQLLCSSVTPNTNFNTHTVTSWVGGKDYSTLTFIGVTADRRKYAEIQRRYRYKFESILQIYKFDEMDVNVDYSCSIGGCENRKGLSLTPDKFEYHPDKDTTTVLASFRNGYLDVIVKIRKVYPIPKCTIMFNENIISQGITTKISVNGIFYMVVQEVEHYFKVCSGQLIVTCVVGKTEIPIHQESFNKCTKTKEESPEYSDNFINSIVGIVLLVVMLLMMGCLLVKYGQLKNALCCRLHWGKEGSTLARNISDIVTQLTIQNQTGSTHDAGQEESIEMML